MDKKAAPKKVEVPSVDSLVGVPCFGCFFNERVNGCNPVECEKLELMITENSGTGIGVQAYPVFVPVEVV